MNKLEFKEGQTYICTKSDKQWWTVGKEYPVFLDSDNEPAIRDDDGDNWHSSYLSVFNNQFKLKEEQPKVTLDEPQKHVMPKFFDKWAKQVLEERDKFYAISLITRAGWGYGVDYELNYDRAPSGTKELLNWIVENEGDDYPNKKKATEALLYGYEVEKEPLWAIKNADGNYLTKCALWGKDGVNYSFECNPSYRLLFTDKATADAAALLVNGIVEEVAER
ncbi:DUF1642 domain-containing protein [Enterococcus faecium]|uniref:DUF1642 domain-containing protein n=1 Tax=Enterococcus faecium TaxID=1352 RepID=UPI001DDB6DC2|nr:DUF1642 domain-containing protein [Enterococcus faecium]MBY3628326.1 DUF1642 domain-containing protein [Enterococcus faecium]